MKKERKHPACKRRLLYAMSDKIVWNRNYHRRVYDSRMILFWTERLSDTIYKNCLGIHLPSSIRPFTLMRTSSIHGRCCKWLSLHPLKKIIKSYLDMCKQWRQWWIQMNDKILKTLYESTVINSHSIIWSYNKNK